jgi:hypothetical protein
MSLANHAGKRKVGLCGLPGAPRPLAAAVSSLEWENGHIAQLV